MNADQTRSRWIEGSIIVGFWLFIFLLTAGQRAIDPRGSEGISSVALYHTGLEYFVWLLITPGIFWFSRHFTFDQADWPRNIAVHVTAALAVAIALDFFQHWTFGLFFPGHRYAGFHAWERIIDFRYLDELFIYLVVLAAGFARDYFWRFRERQAEAIRLRQQAVSLEAQLAESRLHALRMQINPHFLFNTLHAVSSLVERDPAGVRRMIARLSDLLRYTLEGSGSQEVTLKQELDFLRGYLEIQQIRFQGRLEVHEAIDPEVLDGLVPSMILQPLVENAVKHGASQVEGRGRIEIRAQREDGELVVSVHDNGPGFDAMPSEPLSTTGVGLRNTRERLDTLYGSDHRLALQSSPLGGLIARVSIPYHTAGDFRTTLVDA